MKRLRLKKKYKLFFLLLILFLIIILYFLLFNKSKEVIKDIDYVEKIYDKLKDKDISKGFITWINKNYKGSLIDLNNLLKDNDYDKNMWHTITGYSYIVLNDLYNDSYKNMQNVKMLDLKVENILSFVGDVSLADDWHIAPKYDERGGIDGILSKNMQDIMINSDLMVVNSEFTVSNRGSKIPTKQFTFRAKPERLKIYYEMGVDLVTLANNHVYDYGKDAFLDMLDAFDEYKIPRIGAGRDIEEAKKPYYFIIGGYKFAFINASRAEKYRLTPGATKNSEGIFLCYDPTNVLNQIQEVKKNTDYVVAIYHYGKENYHELEQEQIDLSKKSIDYGADIVIGHHAHTLQGIEIYNDKPIIYNLGNFLFNQVEIETVLFQMILDNNGNFEYKMIPALQKDYKTDILENDRRLKVINDINSWSINAYIDEDGFINKK